MKYLNENVKGRLVEIVFNDSDSSSNTLFSNVRKGENIDPSKLFFCGPFKTIKVDDRSRGVSITKKSPKLRDELARRIQKFQYTHHRPNYMVVSELEIFIEGNTLLYYVSVHGAKPIKPKKSRK